MEGVVGCEGGGVGGGGGRRKVIWRVSGWWGEEAGRDGGVE